MAQSALLWRRGSVIKDVDDCFDDIAKESSTTTKAMAASMKSLQHFINRHNVLAVYRKALRTASRTRCAEHKRDLFREIRTQFETHRHLKSTDVGHLLSDARLRLRELRELVDMTVWTEEDALWCCVSKFFAKRRRKKRWSVVSVSFSSFKITFFVRGERKRRREEFRGWEYKWWISGSVRERRD